MAGGFNMMALMNEATKNEAVKPKYEMKNLSIEQIIPNPANLYSMEGIDELADSILLAGRVLQNIVVKAADENGQYMIISGHRRHEACKKLVAEGHPEFGTIAALVENEADENLRELMLIYTNSTSRILTDAEKMHQAQRATELLKSLKAEGKFTERIRETVARMLGTTGAQLARYAAIHNNLTNPELKEAFEDGRLGVSAAYEASGLSKEGQEQIADKLTEGGEVSIQDVKDAKEKEKPAKTNHEGIPMRDTKLKLHKKFRAEIIIHTIEHEGKFYSASDVWCLGLGGTGSYPSISDTAYDTEQEAIETEITSIAERHEKLHQILWESGYYIVGDPAAAKQEETALPPADHDSQAGEMDAPPTEETETDTEPPASVENEPPAEPEEETPAESEAENETETEEEISEDDMKDRARRYAYETVMGELVSLRDSYQGAAERHDAIAGDKQGMHNLEATAKYLQYLINHTEMHLMAQQADA